jgi:hypothetical protein
MKRLIFSFLVLPRPSSPVPLGVIKTVTEANMKNAKYATMWQ